MVEVGRGLMIEAIVDGPWKTHQRKTLLVDAADAAPDSKFIVK